MIYKGETYIKRGTNSGASVYVNEAYTTILFTMDVNDVTYLVREFNSSTLAKGFATILDNFDKDVSNLLEVKV